MSSIGNAKINIIFFRKYPIITRKGYNGGINYHFLSQTDTKLYHKRSGGISRFLIP